VPRLQAKSFATPDDVRALPNVRVETVELDDAEVGWCRFDPAWRWSTDMAPIIGTSSCQVRHVGYTVSGAVHVAMDDGQTLEIHAGDVFDIPPGHDKWVLGDEPWVALEWGASGRAFRAALDDPSGRTLATVMFTDIVESTTTLSRMGDQGWQELLLRHNAKLREHLNVFRGREVKTTGDGFLTLFDSPARAVRCAAAMGRSARAMELRLRVGIHTGEVEMIGNDARGIAVHTAARVLAAAGPGDVLVTSTTHELLEGSGLAFEDAGEHELKGIVGARRLFRLVEPATG
jgi:class 3 adenylate cyclase